MVLLLLGDWMLTRLEDAAPPLQRQGQPGERERHGGGQISLPPLSHKRAGATASMQRVAVRVNVRVCM